MQKNLNEIEKLLDELHLLLTGDLCAIVLYNSEVQEFLDAGGDFRELEYQDEFAQCKIDYLYYEDKYYELVRRFNEMKRKQRENIKFDVILTGHQQKQVNTPEGSKTFTTN